MVDLVEAFQGFQLTTQKWNGTNAGLRFEGNPCNMHLLDLSEKVKASIEGTNKLVGMRFNTIGVSDAINMGTTGMRYSLQSRDLIADSIEMTMR